MNFRILAATFSNTIGNFRQGGDAKLSHSAKNGANDETGGYYKRTWDGIGKFN